MVLNADEVLAAERAAVTLLLAQRVAGLVVAPTSRGDVRHLAEVQGGRVALVLLDRRVEGSDVDQVYADNHAGAAAAMTRLTAAGHRRCRLRLHHRALGVLRAVGDAGLAVPADVAVVAGDEPVWSRVTTPAAGRGDPAGDRARPGVRGRGAAQGSRVRASAG